MFRSYVKMECLAEEVFRRKAAGETNREIGEHFGLSKEQARRNNAVEIVRDYAAKLGFSY